MTDRVLVLVDGSPASVRAIRRGAALASALHAAFAAVIVETPATDRQPFDRARDLQEAIDDAIDLGAEVVRIEAVDIASGVEEAARLRRATHVVLPHHQITGLQRLRERPLVDRIIEHLPDVEVHSIGAATKESKSRTH